MIRVCLKWLQKDIWILKPHLKRKKSDVTYGQVWWPILGICALHLSHPSAHTHSREHTHTHREHPEQWAAIHAVTPEDKLGVRCLAQGHLSHGIEGGESSWGFSVLLKSTSVVILKVEGAVGGSVSCSRAPQSWYWRWREQLGVRCLAQGHLSRGIEGGESSWGFGALLKGTSVVVLKVERAVGGSVSCSRAPQSWYWRWREQLGVRCLAQGHLSRGIEGGERAVGGSVPCSRAPQSWYWRWRESSWGFGVLLKGTSVVVLKVERAVGGSVSCSRAPQSWYWRWRESSWGFGALLKSTSVVVLKVERAVGGSVSCSRAPQSWYWRWREQLGVRYLAQGHLSRGIEGGESSWGFGTLLKGTSVVVLKVERAVGGSVSCSRAPQSWYWRWREQLGVRCLAQGHLSRGIEGGERAVGGSVPCSRAPQSWYWRWREQLGVRCLAQGHLSRGIEGGESSWGFGVLLKDTSVVVLKVERAVGGSVPCSRAPQSWYWRWRERCTFTPPTNSSCQPKTRTHNLSIMSPTLKPLGHYLKIYIFSNCSVDTNTVYRTNLITMLHYKCATNTVALFKESVKCIHGWNI